MSDFEWKTKKEKILANTRKDPFLKIDDLAKLANTTPRYVRTILSEANLSLMQLRREYARKMENKDGNVCDNLLFKYLLNIPFSSNEQELKSTEFIFNNPEDLDSLSGSISEEYFCRSYLHLIKDSPWCISTALVKKGKVRIGEQVHDNKKFVSTLCDKLRRLKGIRVNSIDMEVERSTSQIATLLDISPLAPVFKVKQEVELDYNSSIIVLMLLYFDYKQIFLSFSQSNGLLINRKGGRV